MRKDFNSNIMIYRKYAKNYRHNTNILTFLKSNYKYKRRNYHVNNKQRRLLPHFQRNFIMKHKLPANKETIANDKQIKRTNFLYENTKLYKFLRIFILIMQQETLFGSINNSKNNYRYIKRKGDNSRLVRGLFTKIKAIKTINKSLSKFNVHEEDKQEDGIYVDHRVHKDADIDTDINADSNNIFDKTSHQQSNYDKVSTNTSTKTKCQRSNQRQINTTNSSASLSSFSLTAMMAKTSISSSSPSIANYETGQYSAILSRYIRDNLEIYQHQYHQKTKQSQHQHQCQHNLHHALNMESFTTSRLPNINETSNSNNNNSSCTSSIFSSMRTGIYQSVYQYVNATLNRSNNLSYLFLTLFIAFTISVRSTTAGACWQTVLDNGKCNEIFSLNISKSACCGANQEFAYTEREPTNVEYFFATAIGGGMDCSPCLESCKNVKCGPNKKCVKRKGRPKCICAPECGAARRKHKQQEHLKQQDQQPQEGQYQHHNIHLDSSHSNEDTGNKNVGDDGYSTGFSAAFKISIEKSQQSRDTRSLSSVITNVNLGLENGKDAMISSGVTSTQERYHCKGLSNQNQRKFIHHSHCPQQDFTHQSQQQLLPNHRKQERKGSRRLLITTNVEDTEKPTTRRLQIFSNVKMSNAGRHSSTKNNNNDIEHGQHEDTDPSDYDKENNEDYNNYDDAEDDAAQEDKKRNKKKSSNIGNSHSKNNRNDDSTRFLNQSPSRHKLKTNTKPNNNSNINRNRKTNKNKSHHDLQTIRMQELSSNNNTRVRHTQQNGRHAEYAPHSNHNHYHRQQPNQQEQKQHHNHQQQQQSKNRSRHKHNNKSNYNKQHHKQPETIVLKKPKIRNNYNITNISNSTNTNTNSNSNTSINFAVLNTSYSDAEAKSAILHQLKTVKTTTIIPTSLKLSLSSLSPVVAATINGFNTAPQETQLLLTSFAPSFFSSTTPVNSTISVDNDAATAADDHYHSRLPNHGSKIATSSLLSSSSPSSSQHSQESAVSARFSSKSAVVTMSAKGEGVSLHDHKHSFEEIPTQTTPTTFNHNNNDNIISALKTNLHNSQQQQDQQQQQTSLFDGISEHFDLMRFPNKQQQRILTKGDSVRPLNPVCGSDGRSYNTECQLRKRACRTDNPNLHIAYRGHCRTTCNGVKCLNGLTCVEDQYSMPHCIACRMQCPHDDYGAVDAARAVCGADGKTYKSECDINRMICKIGRSIGVAYSGPCRDDQVTCDDINCGPKQVCLIDLLTHKPRCTSCRYKCSRKRRPSSSRFEEDKICGFNNRTYNSWCEMRKDSCSTGFYIDVKYSGECH